MPLFTAENAAEHARRAVKSRLNRIQAEKQAETAIIERPISSAIEPDEFSLTLACACDETLNLVRTSKQPIHRAQLARALRDLRETWHLATGKPRPGLTRPDQARPVRREVPRNVQPMFNGNSHSQNTR